MLQAFTFLSILLGLVTSTDLTEPTSNESSAGGETGSGEGGDVGGQFDPNG